MNIQQLQYFHAVCVYKTVSAAAEFLHISQPAVSNAVRELEKEFGVQLFHRQYRGMVLTRHGEALYARCAELLSSFEQTKRMMSDFGDGKKLLRLGVPPMIGSQLLPKIYQDFLPRQENMSLQITECGQNELLSKLSDGTVDMVFLPHQSPLEKQYGSFEVTRYEIVFCAGEEHPLARRGAVTPKELKDVPLVLFKDGFFQTKLIRRWFAEGGVEPCILLQTEQLSTMQSMIEGHRAAGFLFRKLIEKKKYLKAIPAQPPMWIRVSLVWKKDSYISDAMKAMQQYAKSLQGSQEG